jgi:Cu(I)/Ag(I) efflux system membrane fusion protein
MTQSVKAGTSVVVGIVLGAAASALVFFNLDRGDSPSGADANAGVSSRDKPLYWVAPMDPDYRRDKPGKSPMGMDLVPVYAIGAGGADEGPGTIEISPEVVNNLGVRTAHVERRALSTRIRTVGYVQYDQDRLIHIHPRVEGWIEKLYVKAAGDPVVQGQPLYELYSPQLVNAQEEMLLSLKRNNQRLVQAAQDRLLALQLSASFIDELKRERQVRQTITFRAPQSGVVDNLNIREGFFVKPGTTLMSIGALDDVWVEAEVFARQAALVEVGLPVVMTLNYLPGKEWRGTVDYVYPSLDEKTRTLRLRLRFNNAAGILKPNMFAQVFIEAGRGEDALMIPREAVIRTGSQDRVVLALGAGRFKSVAVRLGQLDEQYSQILEGLKEGDMIVVSAQFLLDSESSKSSDFMRMHLSDSAKSGMEDAAPDSHHQHTGADHD